MQVSYHYRWFVNMARMFLYCQCSFIIAHTDN